MRNATGYLLITSPDAPAVEQDSFRCGHCGSIVFVEPRADPASCGGFCRVCMQLTCAPCTGDGKCVPLEKRLEADEKRAESRRRMDAAMASMAAV